MTCVPMTTSPGAAAPERALGRNGPRLTWREPGRRRFEVSLIITRGTTWRQVVHDFRSSLLVGLSFRSSWWFSGGADPVGIAEVGKSDGEAR